MVLNDSRLQEHFHYVFYCALSDVNLVVRSIVRGGDWWNGRKYHANPRELLPSERGLVKKIFLSSNKIRWHHRKPPSEQVSLHLHLLSSNLRRFNHVLRRARKENRYGLFLERRRLDLILEEIDYPSIRSEFDIMPTYSDFFDDAAGIVEDREIKALSVYRDPRLGPPDRVLEEGYRLLGWR